MIMNQVLLNPGPVTLSPRVRRALSEKDFCHRERDFQIIVQKTIKSISKIYPSSKKNYVPILLGGSGTTSVEAMIVSLIPKNARVLVLCNGVYGDRMQDIAIRAGIDAHAIPFGWSEPWDLSKIESCLSQAQNQKEKYTHILCVHHETTIGRLNDLETLGKLSLKYKTPLLVDAVSSFGAENIDFKKWNILAVASTANKCLHGAPGLSFVIAKKHLITASNSRRQDIPLTLDLQNHYKAQASGTCAFTLPTHVTFAFYTALKEFVKEGGMKQRQILYKNRSDSIRKFLADLNILPIITLDKERSSSLASYNLPPKTTYKAIHDKVLKKGFVIYAGQGGLEKSIFRIANMGHISVADLRRLRQAFQSLKLP